MKKIFRGATRARYIAVASVFTCLIAVVTSKGATQLKEARVTQIVNDVKLLLGQAAPRPAVVSDLVRTGSAVRTGTQSRSELTFADLTITRLGANTIFSFNEGTREMNLIDGAILFQVPKGSGGATIKTTGVTVGITGTTGIGEFHPAKTSKALPFSKWLCLEGTFHLYLANGQSVEVGPGKMVTTDGKSFSKVASFDIAKLVSTSLFFTGFDTLLPSQVLNLIVLEEQNQIASALVATTTTNPLDPTRIVNVTSQAVVADEAQAPPSSSVSPPPPTPPPPTPPPPTPPPPTPTPSKFGTLTVITSPDPYLITSGTVITTDPSITTNGVTDFGKIYRGPTIDGAFSLWAFASTSAFDTALGVDNFFADPTRFPIAAFKFQSLSLTGNPTIDLSNGGVTKLALIGVNGITSGPPGGTLTFTGLDLLALGTVNGSINLTSDVSFQDLNELAMYARGAGSNLILDSPISNIGDLKLGAEGSIQLTNPGTMNVGQFDATAGDDLTLQIGGSLLLNGSVRLNTLVLPGTTIASGANLTLNVTGDYTNSSATEFSRLRVTNEGAHIGTGGNINVSIGGDLTTTGLGGDFELEVRNTNGQIDNGGNITLNAGGNLSTQGQLNLLIENYDFSANPAGHIGTGGNIFVTTGGDLTADSISAVTNNQNGGTIDSGASLIFNISGALTTVQNGTDYFGGTESLSLTVTNRYDNTLGSTIGGDATLALYADSANIGGNLYAAISDRGGTINGNALLNFNVTHDLTVQGDASWQILNDDGTTINFPSPIGGTIHGSANLLLSAANLTVPAGSLDVEILNQNSGVTGPGGTIDSSANITFNLSGNLTTQVDAGFEIRNNYAASGPGGIGGIGGTIGQDAVINVNANSLSIGGTLDTSLHNGRNAGDNGGTIGGNATINLVVVGGITALDDSQFIGNGGGSIGSNAAIAVSAASLATTDTALGALSASINNNAGGSIGGSASINFALSGNLTSASDANFLIDNSNGGTIGGNAIINFGVSGDINIVGGATFQILNNDGGQIANSANISVGTGGDLTAGSIFAFINNHNTGSIGSGANLTFNIGGALVTQGDATFVISNLNEGPGGGTIGSLASVDINAASISVGGFFQTFVGANGGGSITGNASNTVNVTGDLVVPGPILADIQDTGFIQINPIIFIAGGHIGGDATVTLAAQNITTFSTATGVPGIDTMALEASIYSNGSGTIGGNAIVNVLASQNISAPGTVFFTVANGNYQGFGGGTIGGDAQVNVTATNLSTGALFDDIYNYGGASIGGKAIIGLNLSGDLTTSGAANFQILNNNGTIGSGADITVHANNITANSLFAQIDNSNGGVIGVSATIDMHVSGTANVTSDATFEILGSDGAAAAAINFNQFPTPAGGSYDAGGTFLAYIDGDGTITFNNASAHADVLKAGVFGNNGTLRIGGGTLSADTTLELYAPGSNGQLNFVSNVTLGGNSAKILAANSVTIFNNVVVTIGGPNPADVYTNNANYTGFGGNKSTTGTFAGAGANNPQPLSSAPPFGPFASAKLTTGGNIPHVMRISPRPPSTVTTGGNVADVRRASNVINVRSSDELLSLLDGAAPGPGRKITIPPSKSANNSRNSSRMDATGRPNAASRLNTDVRSGIRTASLASAGRLPQ